ncbi:MAG: carboxymethylenebutenolidase [Gammaproteobacteria bacterium]|jgi:carboxymethylenebutenolidase
MGQNIQLTASDGHTFTAYRAEPNGAPKGGVVVIQEIFGVNAHMREVADGYAAAGYLAIAPALFDRKQRDLELGYDEKDIVTGRDIAFPLGWEEPTLDLEAAVAVAKEGGKVGTVGYCWGGSLSFISACRLDVNCSVGYYGGQITKYIDAGGEVPPKAPTMLHFGTQDAGIPLDDVERIRSLYPSIPIHMYEAGHGFNCDHRGSYDEAATKLALERTLAFFAENLA